MIDHVEIFVQDQKKSCDFYSGALQPLGYALRVEGKAAGFGESEDKVDFFVREGGPSVPLPHIAFHCVTRELVDISHRAALAAGGVPRTAPVLQPLVHASYYAGTILDPDGHIIEFACHRDMKQAA
ncbi:MAG: VOC family protein [Betaproteobacteria bacterium]